jgi:hypothetical protein
MKTIYLLVAAESKDIENIVAAYENKEEVQKAMKACNDYLLKKPYRSDYLSLDYYNEAMRQWKSNAPAVCKDAKINIKSVEVFTLRYTNYYGE